MIQGIGIDIIEIERIRTAIGRHEKSFLSRLFTEKELEKVESASDAYRAIHVAGRFAAKEAVVKALGTGFQGINWKDIQILNDEAGKPIVLLSHEIATRFNQPKLLITISHSKEHATAFCVWEQ